MGYEKRASSSFKTLFAIFFLLGVLLVVLLVCLLKLPRSIPIPHIQDYNCPDKISPESFLKFPEGVQDVVLSTNRFLLDKSVNVNTITVTDGALLVVADTGNPIKIRTKYILLQNSASLMIGSESCPYRSQLDIALYGRSDDPENVFPFGRRFIGIEATTSIDIHGPWKLSWTFLTASIPPGPNDVIINLEVDSSTWGSGDEIVIASSSYNMNQTERFTLLDCPTCSNYQVKIKGPVRYAHGGEITPEGVRMRAEVGLLTRNIKIHGEMQPACYLDNKCDYFNYDTYGGQTQVLVGAVNARFEGIELYNMGQQVLGSYPIHFHKLGYAYGKYARQLSIHDCFSRCVTLHNVQGVVVEDVVGYNTLGHCFFLEDGNEFDNTLRHNLGLVTKASTVLPSDRNDVMCVGLTANPSKYVPDPNNDCKSVSTFWLSHPNNTIENNSAAGSEEVGFQYAFYIGLSGNWPLPGYLNPLRKFSGNIAHSNAKAGLYMNNWLKLAPPSDDDPRDERAVISGARYAPHVDRDMTLARVAAVIDSYTGYKNTLGLMSRGGDVVVQSAKVTESKFSHQVSSGSVTWQGDVHKSLADNDIAVILASSGTLPYDPGSHQQILDSTIVGKTNNNEEWNNRLGSNVGVQIQDGPVMIGGNKFYSFISTAERKSYALGFLPNNPGVSSPLNIITQNNFDNKSAKLYLGPPSSGDEMDGDRTQNLFDGAGSLTGVPGSRVVRADNPLLVTSRCQNSTNMAAVTYCPTTNYGLVFINSTLPGVTLDIQDVTTPSETWRRLTLTGVSDVNTTVQYQPVVLPNHSYRMIWSSSSAPQQIHLSSYALNLGEYVDIEICYPSNSTFNVTSWSKNQITGQVMREQQITQTESLDQVTTRVNNNTQQLFYWDNSTRLLHLRLLTTWQTTNFDYCPSEGCNFITVSAQFSTNTYTKCDSL